MDDETIKNKEAMKSLTIKTSNLENKYQLFKHKTSEPFKMDLSELEGYIFKHEPHKLK